MTRISIATLGALAVLSMSCNDTGDGGGGPGGGFVFNSGYAFVRPDTRDVEIVDSAAPNTVQPLTSNGDNHTPTISPDGNSVVFVHGTSTGSGEIDTVPSTGTSAPSPLYVPTNGATNLRDPAISPDGRKIAFTFDRNGSSFIATIDRATGGNYLEVTPAGSTSYGSPSWVDNGTLFAAAGASPSNLTDLVTIDASGSMTINSVTTLSGAVANRVVLSPDGTMAVYDSRFGSANTPRVFVIFLSGANAGGINRLTDHASEPSASDTFPAWASGGAVAFSSDSGNASQVYTISSSVTTAGAGSLAVPSAIEPWFH
jgi:dipeptidyl aminopeptidase/acylaminoacyl peptidase